MKDLQQLQGLQERLVIDTSEGNTVYLIAVGLDPTYIRLSPTSYYLLQQRSLGISFNSLAETLSQPGKQILATEVETAYNKVVEQIAEIERNPKLNRLSFWFRFTLLPKAVVIPIANCLSVAFSKPVAYCLIAFIVAATAIAPRHDLGFDVTPTVVLWGYLLFVGSVLMHELGHASACARYGAQPSEIGFTIYFIWPAFYSDVSAAWKLKRWQRVVVDIGGVFFQLVTAAVYAIAYTFTGWTPLKLALLMIAGTCLFNLNPIFKFDGYWVVADALGVTNLSQQPSRIFRHFFDKVRGLPVNPLPWSPFVLAVLSIYAILSFSIWGYFLWMLLPVLCRELLAYPSKVMFLMSNLLKWPIVLDIKQLQSFFGSTFIVTIALMMLWRLVKPAISRGKVSSGNKF